jgi:hypothetical protein
MWRNCIIINGLEAGTGPAGLDYSGIEMAADARRRRATRSLRISRRLGTQSFSKDIDLVSI